MALVKELTGANFNDFITYSGTFTFIDFYTQTCNPCKILEPIIVELAEEYNGKIKFARLDRATGSHIFNQYLVMGVPQFIIFSSEGNRISQFAGNLSKNQLKEKIEEAFAL